MKGGHRHTHPILGEEEKEGGDAGAFSGDHESNGGSHGYEEFEDDGYDGEEEEGEDEQYSYEDREGSEGDSENEEEEGELDEEDEDGESSCDYSDDEDEGEAGYKPGGYHPVKVCYPVCGSSNNARFYKR